MHTWADEYTNGECILTSQLIKYGNKSAYLDGRIRERRGHGAYLDERTCEDRLHILLGGYMNRKCILGLMNIRMESAYSVDYICEQKVHSWMGKLWE